MDLLEPGQEKTVIHHFPRMEETVNFFSTNLLARAAHLRRDDKWIQEALHDSRTKFVVFSNLQPLVISQSDSDDPAVPKRMKLCTLSATNVAKYLKDNATYVFLGLEKDNKEIPWFAIDLSSLNEDQLKEMKNEAELVSPIPSAMQVGTALLRLIIICLWGTSIFFK